MAHETALVHWCGRIRINLTKTTTYAVEECCVTVKVRTRKRVSRTGRLRELRDQLRRGAYVVDSARLIRAMMARTEVLGQIQRLQ